jgi:hypothetical protein
MPHYSLISLLMLPVLADPSWRPVGDEDPSLHILLLLSATVGLPYLMLSTTGPLIQAWAAHTGHGTKVYRLFSLSNLASLLALLCYPFLIEPWLSLQSQSTYVVFDLRLLCGSLHRLGYRLDPQ